MRSRQFGTASDHGCMSVDQAAPLAIGARRQRIALGSLLLAQRLFHTLRRVLRPAGAHLQPKDRRRQALPRRLARHGEQVLRHLGRRLDTFQFDLVGVVEPERLGVDAHQTGDLVLRNAEARERFYEVASVVGRHMRRPAGAGIRHSLILYP